MENFENLSLSTDILNLLEDSKYKTPTDCQLKTIPLLISGKDVVVQSPTGSGKTLAYILPCLNEINKKLSSLIIVPTRELAEQIKNVANDVYKDEICVAFYGGKPIDEDLKKIDDKIKLVIATPGRLIEILKTKASEFDQIKFLIIDEADKLLGLGFETHLKNIIFKINSIKNVEAPKRVTGLFSATINDNVLEFCKLCVRNPVKIESEGVIPEKLQISYVNLNGLEKLKFLLSLINEETIVFFATCASVDYFYMLAKKLGYEVAKIHGKMKQNERSLVYGNMKKCLFCTDVAARGIDFSKIKNVIHFDVPNDPQNFVHRSGRTARNGESGAVTIILMDNELKYVNYLKIKGIIVEEKKVDVPNIQFESKLDEETLKYSVSAFVCYLRSYKEHLLNYILNFKDLDFDNIAKLHFLEKIPRMDELMNVKFKEFEKSKNLNRHVLKLKRGVKTVSVVKSSKNKKKFKK